VIDKFATIKAMSAEALPEPTQLSFIDAGSLAQPERPAVGYSYREVKKRIPEILDRHRLLIAQAMPTLQRVDIPEQARTLFGHFLEKKQRDALGLSFEIRSMAQELVQKNTLVAFYLRYLEEKKLFLALGYRSFKDYALNYFNELEYSYLTRLKRIAYMSSEEIQTLEPLGTTKMMMIAQLDQEERRDILAKRYPVHENEYKNVIDMTTRELGRVVQKHKNPGFRDNLIKGVPGSLMHQLRLLDEHLEQFEPEALQRTCAKMRESLSLLERFLNAD
jgi:hypothetical protein